MEKTKIFAISNEDFDITIRVFNAKTKQLAQLAVDYTNEKLNQEPSKETMVENQVPALDTNKFVRGQYGKFQGLFEKGEMLHNYGKIKIYKPILVYILSKTGYSFNSKNVVEILSEYYREKLNRALTEKSNYTYAKGYIRYMLDENIITRDKLSVCRKVNWGEKKEAELQKIEEAEEKTTINDQAIQKMADEIYELAKKKEWTIVRRNIYLEEIKKGLPSYSDDELKLAFSRLVRFGKMRQSTSDKVIFY